MTAMRPVTHAHLWHLTDRARLRYRCDCGVYGYGRAGSLKVRAYRCQFEHVGRRPCAAPATFVTGELERSRCSAHASSEFSEASGAQRG